jgi:maltooligosyltrehalose trehalohydrolase
LHLIVRGGFVFGFRNDVKGVGAHPALQAHLVARASAIDQKGRAGGAHAGILQLYRDLIGLRRSYPALRERDRDSFRVIVLGESALALRRHGPTPEDTLLIVVNLSDALRLDLAELAATTAPVGLRWAPLLATEDERYGGQGAARLIEYEVVEIDGPGAVVLKAID